MEVAFVHSNANAQAAAPDSGRYVNLWSSTWISACSPLFLGNKRRKKSRDGEKSLEEGSEQLPVTS